MLVEQVMFLATASDSQIHPDSAVAQLEALAAAAAGLCDVEKQALRESVRRRYAAASDVERHALDEIEENFGL